MKAELEKIATNKAAKAEVGENSLEGDEITAVEANATTLPDQTIFVS